jgi:nicotinamide riboside kinase
MREYFYNVYKAIVADSGVPWVEIRGNMEERQQAAVHAIDGLLKEV